MFQSTGSQVSYSCRGTKYLLVGDSVRTCKEGMWTGEEPHCECK